MWRLWPFVRDTPLGMFASAILGVGLLVMGAAIGIGGGDVPDGWERTQAEIVDRPPGFESRRSRRALGNITVRYLEYPDAGGELVVRRCEHCWGGIGDEVPIAYDPVRPTNLRQVNFYLVPTAFCIVVGTLFLVFGVWRTARSTSPDGRPRDG